MRKACAENFMAVSSEVSRDTRCNELTDIYMVLLKDQSRWVSNSFINTFLASVYQVLALFKKKNVF